MLKYTV